MSSDMSSMDSSIIAIEPEVPKEQAPKKKIPKKPTKTNLRSQANKNQNVVQGQTTSQRSSADTKGDISSHDGHGNIQQGKDEHQTNQSAKRSVKFAQESNQESQQTTFDKMEKQKCNILELKKQVDVTLKQNKKQYYEISESLKQVDIKLKQIYKRNSEISESTDQVFMLYQTDLEHLKKGLEEQNEKRAGEQADMLKQIKNGQEETRERLGQFLVKGLKISKSIIDRTDERSKADIEQLDQKVTQANQKITQVDQTNRQWQERIDKQISDIFNGTSVHGTGINRAPAAVQPDQAE